MDLPPPVPESIRGRRRPPTARPAGPAGDRPACPDPARDRPWSRRGPRRASPRRPPRDRAGPPARPRPGRSRAARPASLTRAASAAGVMARSGRIAPGEHDQPALGERPPSLGDESLPGRPAPVSLPSGAQTGDPGQSLRLRREAGDLRPPPRGARHAGRHRPARRAPGRPRRRSVTRGPSPATGRCGTPRRRGRHPAEGWRRPGRRSRRTCRGARPRGRAGRTPGSRPARRPPPRRGRCRARPDARGAAPRRGRPHRCRSRARAGPAAARWRARRPVPVPTSSTARPSKRLLGEPRDQRGREGAVTPAVPRRAPARLLHIPSHAGASGPSILRRERAPDARRRHRPAPWNCRAARPRRRGGAPLPQARRDRLRRAGRPHRDDGGRGRPAAAVAHARRSSSTSSARPTSSPVRTRRRWRSTSGSCARAGRASSRAARASSCRRC